MLQTALAAPVLSGPGVFGAPARSDRLSWSNLAGDVVEQVRSLGIRRLSLLLPEGSESNLAPVVAGFEEHTGVKIEQQVVPVRDMSTRMLLDHRGGTSNYDLALPATFEVADLVRAGVLRPLDDYVERFEPAELPVNMLYSTGSRHLGQFYGYQTDGDCYLLFLNRALLDAELCKRLEDALSVPVAPDSWLPGSWQAIDATMAIAADTGAGRFGGNLFRTPGYLVWEFLLRLYSRGVAPLAANLSPQIAGDDGVAALTALLDTSSTQHPATTKDELFGNWASYAEGRSLFNIGWGGSQKSFRRAGEFADRVESFLAPGPGGGFGYFNWGWNYCVTASSRQPLAAYLFTLFATAPSVSTQAVRAPDGYFDPYLIEHYDDPVIESTYSRSFLDTHAEGMQRCVPDLYLIGQGEYFAALTRHLQLAYEGKLSAHEALTFASRDWQRLNERFGEQQWQVWQALRARHPDGIIDRPTGQFNV